MVVVKKYSGFTMIELMIAIVIVGVLSAIAIPAYFGYVKRSKVSEALSMSSKYQAEISECYQNKAALPDCDELTNGIGERQTGKYGTVNVMDGIITYTFNASGVDDDLNGKTVQFTPDVSGGINSAIKFACTSNVNDSFLPSSCKLGDVVANSGGSTI